jgi:methylosome protein 50
MDEFLFCIDYNRNNEIITGLNFLTYQHWESYITCFNDSEFVGDFLVSSPFGKTHQKIECNICALKWLTDKDILVATDEGSLIIYEHNKTTQAYTETFYKCEHDGGINSISLNSHKDTVLTASQDNSVKLWDVKNELSTRTFRCHRAGVVGVEFSQFDSRMFLSCSQDSTALLWDLSKTKPALKLNLARLNGEIFFLTLLLDFLFLFQSNFLFKALIRHLRLGRTSTPTCLQ